MCFFKLRLQSFLERKSREATCFPSHGDWLNTVTQSHRTGEPENSRGAHNCTVVTPPPGLKCVTSSEFEHNVVQCAWSQLPVGEYNVASMSVTREHGGNKRHCFPLSDQLRIPFNFVAIFPMCGPHHIFESDCVWHKRLQLVREKDNTKDWNDLVLMVMLMNILMLISLLTLMLMLVIMRRSWVDDTRIL